MPDDRSEMVLIGGRSGVGKSSVAEEMHWQLSDAGVQHAVIEGDALDLAWPAPWQHGLAEHNLAAIWANYRALGYRRLIYTNTVSVLEAEQLAAAMGDDPVITTILLTGTDEAIAHRLGHRERGSQLEAHLERSRLRAAELDQAASPSTWRVATDSRDITEIAHDLIVRLGWTLEEHTS